MYYAILTDSSGTRVGRTPDRHHPRAVSTDAGTRIPGPLDAVPPGTPSRYRVVEEYLDQRGRLRVRSL